MHSEVGTQGSKRALLRTEDLLHSKT
jgi:hypothetical protein